MKDPTHSTLKTILGQSDAAKDAQKTVAELPAKEPADDVGAVGHPYPDMRTLAEAAPVGTARLSPFTPVTPPAKSFEMTIHPTGNFVTIHDSNTELVFAVGIKGAITIRW